MAELLNSTESVSFSLSSLVIMVLALYALLQATPIPVKETLEDHYSTGMGKSAPRKIQDAKLGF